MLHGLGFEDGTALAIAAGSALPPLPQADSKHADANMNPDTIHGFIVRSFRFNARSPGQPRV